MILSPPPRPRAPAPPRQRVDCAIDTTQVGDLSESNVLDCAIDTLEAVGWDGLDCVIDMPEPTRGTGDRGHTLLGSNKDWRPVVQSGKTRHTGSGWTKGARSMMTFAANFWLVFWTVIGGGALLTVLAVLLVAAFPRHGHAELATVHQAHAGYETGRHSEAA